ncbi:MAG: DUF4439 domain-containing protein [Nocardioides sp.]
MSTDASIEALQRTLAGEHAAIYVLAALGGRASTLTAPALRTALASAYGAHVERRDRLRLMIASAGTDPVAAEPAYRIPADLDTAAQIESRALAVEQACTSTYSALVAATTDGDRRWAVEALVATAVAEAAFGARPQALPGLDR